MRHRYPPALLALFAVGVLLLTACGSGGQGPKATDGSSLKPAKNPNVTVAVANEVAVQSDLFLAQQLGFFKSFGLNVTIKNVGLEIVPEIVSGGAQLGFEAVGSSLQAEAAGTKLAFLVPATYDGTQSSIAAGPSIHSLSQCKNVASATTGETHDELIHIEKYYNWSATVVTFSSSTAEDAALSSGSVDCAEVNLGASDIQDLLAQGKIHLLVDGSTSAFREKLLGAPYVTTYIFGAAKVLGSDPGTYERFDAAWMCADDWMRSHSNAQIASKLLSNSLWAGATTASTIAALKVELPLLPKPAPTESAYNTMLTQLPGWNDGFTTSQLNSHEFSYSGMVLEKDWTAASKVTCPKAT